MSTIHAAFSSWLITSNFSSMLIVFHWFFTWIAAGDVDLHLSLMSIREASAVGEGTTWAAWLYHQHHQFIHMTDGVTVTPLSASLLQKMSAAFDCLCQIVLNQKLSCTFETCRKFSSSVKAKSCKKKSHARRVACTEELFKIQNTDLMNFYIFSKHHFPIRYTFNKTQQNNDIKCHIYMMSFPSTDIFTEYQPTNHLMFSWPCIMNWLYTNYQILWTLSL
jgi:hypothetical protein